VLDVENGWFGGGAAITTYRLEELLGTKLRALYQRSKGRDLFDLAVTLDRVPEVDRAAVLRCFMKYADHQGVRISRSQFEENLATKLEDPGFGKDVEVLLASAVSVSTPPTLANVPVEVSTFDVKRAAATVREALISTIP
jgi:hypothetical protein